MLDLSWGELAVIAAVLLLLFAPGRKRLRKLLGDFSFGVKKGLRDDDPGIRVREPPPK
jgi:Sec-independent protein translocase protein TatA